ncbi:MAG: hypothetical protein ABJC04_00385 [Verrucomicrobiota bacterium]
MSSTVLKLRTVLIFSFAIILSILGGYLVAKPLNYTSLAFFVGLGFLFALPLLLRWHFPLLILCWNTNMVVLGLKGQPPFWLFMIAISFSLTCLYYALDKRQKYLYVPSVIAPLIFLAGVVVLTAKIRGGIGLNMFGGGESGGKRYIFILAPIVGYFALTAHRIPWNRAYAYVVTFFIGFGSSAIAVALPFLPSFLWFLFAIFPPEMSSFENLDLIEKQSITRFGGLTTLSTAIFCILLACYGIRGILNLSSPLKFLPFSLRGGFEITRPWRMIFFLGALAVSFLGGFRSAIIVLALLFSIQFYFERLFRSRLFPILAGIAVTVAVCILPITDHLPLSMQRTLSFLPVNVDPAARLDAAVSTEWRLQIWRRVLPEVPDYFWVGKGFSLNTREMELLSSPASTEQNNTIEMAILAQDYHSGPLTLLLPLGIGGLIGFIWFLIASIKVLLKNYRNSPPQLLTLNTFLLSYFMARSIFFFLIFGSFYSDLLSFVGVIGLSISLNHGVNEKKRSAIPEIQPLQLIEA